MYYIQPRYNYIYKKLSTTIRDLRLHHDKAYRYLNNLYTYDSYSFYHSIDVCAITLILLVEYGYKMEKLDYVALAALLHDVGKLKIPIRILNNPSRLSIEEYSVMKKHPLYGYLLLKDTGSLPREVCQLVLQHHEKLNGSGYPFKKVKEDIAIMAQAISVADVFDALISERPYKKAYTIEKTLSIMYDMSGKELNANFIYTLKKIVYN